MKKALEERTPTMQPVRARIQGHCAGEKGADERIQGDRGWQGDTVYYNASYVLHILVCSWQYVVSRRQ